MSAFIRALYETNMVGIGRYVLRKDSQPKVVALVPKIKTDSEVSMKNAASRCSVGRCSVGGCSVEGGFIQIFWVWERTLALTTPTLMVDMCRKK